eukprot:g583.t1 g583   contig10:337497-338541(-)
MPSYYNIDTILAEEELIVARPAFDFALLSHLDPDSHRLATSTSSAGRKRARDDTDKENALNGTTDKLKSVGGGGSHALPAGTKIKMPMWALERWAMLGFIRISSLPKHYGKRMKERLEADPVSVDLRSKNEHYFLTGLLLTSFLHRTVHAFQKSQRRKSKSRSSANNAQKVAMENISLLATSLQQSLLTTMMGDRLCRNFDWTLSALDSMEDDVSGHLLKLSVLEKSMFERGVEASGAVGEWREYGCSRMGVSVAVVKGKSMGRGLEMTTSGGVGENKKAKVVGLPLRALQ